MFKKTNPNPINNLVGDCVIRAISILTDRSWQYTLDELEHSDISVNNAIELASLYIIRINDLTGINKEETGGILGEIEDILPAYTEYRQVKTQYQINNLPDFVVVRTLRLAWSL